MAISGVSTLIVLGGLAVALVTSPGWHALRITFFSWSAFRDSFGQVLSGFWLDVRLFLIVEVIVLVVGMLIALARTVHSPALFPLRLLAIVFVDVLRGVPTILVVYLIGFGVPTLAFSGIPTGAVFLGGPRSPSATRPMCRRCSAPGSSPCTPARPAPALALGLTPRQTLRHVVLPQAVRRVIPPLLNDFIALQKDVALVSILGPQEAFRVAQIFAASTFNYTPLLAAAALYLCVTIPLTRIVDRLQARSRRERGAALALGPR